MCSILMTNKTIKDLHWINQFLKVRGPDATSLLQVDDVSCLHNLLSITGQLTPQPIVDQDIIAMHNGEIYNYGDYPSDAYCLIPLYKEYGNRFVMNLDGEFATVLLDRQKRHVIVATDCFRTKPLWWALQDNNWGFCTYRTPLEQLGFVEVRKVPANRIWRLDLNLMQIEDLGPVVCWDLEQYKPHFDDWCQAFEQSIRKRTSGLREKLFLGLSSGYDSGAIACELNKQKIPYIPITLTGKENSEILQLRHQPNHQYITPSHEIFSEAHSWIKQNVEKFLYTICSSSSDYNEFNLELHDDSGSNGLSMVCSHAKKLGAKVVLSGQGSDEIFSDYGFNGQKIYPHSNFGGKFPKDLKEIFPWNSFYGSSMESYLAKEEYVAGSYGIEARYPFLDRQVVQEFLWLTPLLKNSYYKAPLHYYLTQHNYPFSPNQKIGF